MNADFDPRVTAARADLAAAHLRGRIAAPRFAEGRAAQVARGTAGLRAAPFDDAGQHTELLFGERFTIYEEENGWVWGQAESDRYVGYARSACFATQISAPTHRVTARATPVLPAPDVKRAPHDLLPLNAKVSVTGEQNRFARLESGFYVFAGHLAPIGQIAADWVAVAESFLGVPYVWGGKTVAGLDCSGLVQTALEAGGQHAPRDTDMMEAELGTAVPLAADLSGLARGDLVFWKGHMGVMQDGLRLLHANATAMQVASENLADAAGRIAGTEGPIRTIKRLG